MTGPNLWTPAQAAVVRLVLGGVLGVLLLGVLVALATYPGWQLVLAALCLAGALVLGLLLPSRMRVPLHPEVPARDHLRAAGMAVGIVGLLAVGGWLLASAPV